MAQAQCGSSVKRTFQACGGHCNAVVVVACEGTGTFCEDGTGDIGNGCCGAMVLTPGSCQSAKSAPSREFLPNEEFLAFREALEVRNKVFPVRNQLVIASCAPDKNAFHDWLQAKLRERQRQN